jgi:hypothetical protein
MASRVAKSLRSPLWTMSRDSLGLWLAATTDAIEGMRDGAEGSRAGPKSSIPCHTQSPRFPPTHRPPHSTMRGVHVGLAIFIPTANHARSLVPDMAAHILIRQPYIRTKPYTAFPLYEASQWLPYRYLCTHRNSTRTEQKTGSKVLV